MNQELRQLQYYCPGCDCVHAIDPRKHKWNGRVDKPTFTPSLLTQIKGVYKCHSFITDGKIRFLPDCEHELKNQTVELPDIFPEVEIL